MEVGSIDFVFLVRFQKGGMKNVVDSPRSRKLKAISYRSENFCNEEWSFSFWFHLLIVSRFHVS